MAARDDGERGPARTEPLATARPAVRKFALIGTAGPAADLHYTSTGATCAIGSHAGNEVVIDDPSISRSHCEIRVEQGHVRIYDLDSTNGVVLDGVRVIAGYLRDGSTLQLGRSSLRVELASTDNRVAMSTRTELGTLVGTSFAMRACFALLERAAASRVGVLLEGEPGTGKDSAAHAIHHTSARRAAPYLVLDCSAVPGNLLELELFGSAERPGALEAARGGTVFLDEIGELPAALQPRLLHVIERGELRRSETEDAIPVDVRIVAATTRDLRAEVNAGRVRSDLYFALAVMRVRLPPLRERPEDLPLLVERIVGGLSLGHDLARRLSSPAYVAELAGCAWPGNVRELRTYLERAAVIDDLADAEEPPPLDDTEQAPAPYAQARDRVLAEFERRYVEQLLRAHHNNVSAAARASGIDRTYLHRLMRRHGLR